MSDAVMSETSPYRDSIKFYERMSDLQGELKTYETQEFQLEEEFQRLWTQGINLESSSASAVKGPSTTSSQVRIGELGHLSKSQLLANPANLNYYGKNEEDERRRRNKILLDKLQELETNASIFQARSERLRMMRSEYEGLVRKYASSRKRDSEMKPSYYNHNHNSQSFLSVTRSPKIETARYDKALASIGVNTDITGPIISISSKDSIVPTAENIIEASGRETREKLLSSITGRRESKEEDELIYNKTTRPSFLDISSTSESEFVVPKLRQYSQDNFDDTSADTTSMSVVTPKIRGSHYLENVNTDGSLTESTSVKQLPIIVDPILKRITTDAKNNDVVTNTANARTAGDDNNKDGDEKKLIKSVSSVPKKFIQESKDECSSSSDSTSNSIGDSVMDSLQNKIPDSLPKDDSELLHITEVDEEEDIDVSEDQQHQDGDKESRNMLINEMGSQNQETWDNLSSSNLVRVAQKEIGVRSFGEPEDVVQSDDGNQHSGNVDLDTKVNELMNKGSSLRRKSIEDELLIKTDAQPNEEFLKHSTNNKIKFSNTSSSSSFSTNSMEKDKYPEETEKAQEKKGDNPTDHELKKSSEVSSTKKPKTTQNHFSSPIVNPKNPNLAKPSSSSNPFLVSSQRDQTNENKQTSKVENESKKVQKLRLDYDDTESDVSEAGRVDKVKGHLMMHQQPTKLNEPDDEFDGFFD